MAQLTDSKDLDDGGKPGCLTWEVKTYEREDRGRWSKRGRQNESGGVGRRDIKEIFSLIRDLQDTNGQGTVSDGGWR